MEACLFKKLSKRRSSFYRIFKNIYATILYKDIISRFQIRNTQFLENLVQFLSNNIGNVISANKISDYLKSQKLKISPQLVINYLNYLSQAFLIFQVKRNDILGKRFLKFMKNTILKIGELSMRCLVFRIWISVKL